MRRVLTEANITLIISCFALAHSLYVVRGGWGQVWSIWRAQKCPAYTKIHSPQNLFWE